MTNHAFEWDDIKAAENYAKHGVSFELAIEVFKDPFGIERRLLELRGDQCHFISLDVLQARALD